MSKWTDNEPWERQKGESEKAYEAFKIYRDMGQERSIRAVGQRLGKSRALIDRWSSEKDWVERVRAYDNYIEKEAQKKAIKDRKAMVDRHIDLALKLQQKAVEALETMDVEKMKPNDIKEYIKMATELERLNRFGSEDTAQAEAEGAVQIIDNVSRGESSGTD